MRPVILTRIVFMREALGKKTGYIAHVPVSNENKKIFKTTTATYETYVTTLNCSYFLV